MFLNTLDTVSDFIAYLEDKEKLIDCGYLKRAAGEEDLLAAYLESSGLDGKHTLLGGSSPIEILDGRWQRFQQHPLRHSQYEANQISYVWDRLTENFCSHVLGETQAYATHPGVANQERVLRFLARENRPRRRILSRVLMELIERTPQHIRATRTITPSGPGDPHYVFLLLPHPDYATEEQYRDVRRKLLGKYSLIKS